MAKSKRYVNVCLKSSAGTGVRKTARKLKGSAKLVLKKYDFKVRKHVDFEEIKGGFS